MKNIVHTLLTISIEDFKYSLFTAKHFQLDTSNFFLISFCHSLTATCWNFSICDHVPHSALQFWVSRLLMKDKPTYKMCRSYLQSGPWFDHQFSHPLLSPFDCGRHVKWPSKQIKSRVTHIFHIHMDASHTDILVGWLVGWTEATMLISWVLFTLFSLCSWSKWEKVSFREFAGPVKFMSELCLMLPWKLTLKRNASKCVEPQKWLRSLCSN